MTQKKSSYDDCKNSVDKKIPVKYLCPITKELMKEPVIAYDGCVYEKGAIVEYLRQYHTTPTRINSNDKLQQNVIEETINTMLYDHKKLKQEINNWNQ